MARVTIDGDWGEGALYQSQGMCWLVTKADVLFVGHDPDPLSWRDASKVDAGTAKNVRELARELLTRLQGVLAENPSGTAPRNRPDPGCGTISTDVR